MQISKLIGCVLARALLVLLALAMPAMAETERSIARTTIAETHCPSEWSSLIALDPELWRHTRPIRIDPSLEDTATAALNKYFLAIMASGEHIVTLIGFADNEVTPSHFELAKAKYRLWTCLKPTEEERDLIVKIAQQLGNQSNEATIRSMLFSSFDQYDCMDFERVSVEIFDLDPNSKTFVADYEEIISGSLQACG